MKTLTQEEREVVENTIKEESNISDINTNEDGVEVEFTCRDFGYDETPSREDMIEVKNQSIIFIDKLKRNGLGSIEKNIRVRYSTIDEWCNAYVKIYYCESETK